MKKAILLLGFALILLSGCVKLPTADKCENLNEQEVLSGAGWGEVITTDETYFLKTKVGCWHSVALADAARNDPNAAAEHCTKISDLDSDYPDDKDMLTTEFNTCIDAVAKRMRNTGLCSNMDEEEFTFEYERCVAHATTPPPMCASAFILLAGAAFLFCACKK